ncbi:MAG: lamin tail domain-containing protein [Anaerolineae bacterium]|nr:lamin tail domain-containing protein [Anaerolineae bacterium]
MRSKRNYKPFFWAATLLCLLFGGLQIAIHAVRQVPSDVIINEFMAANTTGLTDENGEHADWLELYNPTGHPVNLGGWSLTDDPTQPEKWPLPDIVLGSHAYLLIFASGKDRRAVEPGAALHANFKLNRQGEFLGLYNIFEKRFMDQFSPSFPKQFRDMAYGRYGHEGQAGYLATATPGQPNNDSLVWQGVLPPVEFSVERGVYDAPFTLALHSPDPAATIRFSTDGGQPTETRGLLYVQPILISTTTFVQATAFKPNFLPSPPRAHTYLFLNDVLRQPVLPSGFPKTWGIHEIDFAGHARGEEVQADYELDPNVVNDPRYRPTITDDLQTIPILSITTHPQNFDIYAHPRNRGREWERPVSVELIDPTGSQTGFQINAGLRIQGGAGRWEFMPKHSFRLFFRDEYGAATLKYPLFSDAPVDEFDTLILRGGVDRSYAGHPEVADHALTTYTRDEWLRASQIALSGVGAHGIFVHLYLNGLYWGLYNLVERPDEAFAASYFGGQKEEWYVINHRGTVSGSSDRFSELLALVNSGNLAASDRYALVQAYLDVTQFIDYLILNWYAGTEDWPENNWYAVLPNRPSGRVNFLVWDGEESWNEGAKIHLGQNDLAGRPNLVKIFFEALSQNPDFKMELADRLYKHLSHNGVLTDVQAKARWRRLNQVLDRAIVGESARWGDVRQEPPLTRDDWLKARDNVLAQMEGNAAKLLAQARAMGYYPPLDPPVFNQQGGLVAGDFELTMTISTPVSGATIYYTTNGADPRLPASGQVLPEALIYDTPLPLTTTTFIKARALAGEAGEGPVWSALNEATFKLRAAGPQAALTEIMYNPVGGNQYEFIELKNTGDTDLPLGGAFFDEGIAFKFPAAVAPLAPGQMIVLARNPGAFASRYPGVEIAGVYQGKLSNQGERLTLRNGSGDILVSVAYNDENGWPISPDGRGDSLILVDLAGDVDNPQHWRASIEVNGSPGRDEPAP